MIKNILIMLLVGMLVACADDTTSENVDDPILESLYGDNRTPTGFYVEQVPADNFYTTLHLRDKFNSEISVDTLDDSISLFQQQDITFVSLSETDIYFEAISSRTLDAFLVIDRIRILKSNVLDRHDVALNCIDCYWGIISKEWLTRHRVKTIVEYMWQFTQDNNYQHIVYATTTVETNLEIVHTLFHATLTSRIESCDNIRIFKNVYSVNKSDGSTWKSQIPIRDIINCT